MINLGEMKITSAVVIMVVGICSCVSIRHQEVPVPYQTVTYVSQTPDRTALLNDSLRNQILSFGELNSSSSLGAKALTMTTAIEGMCDSLENLIEQIKVYIIEYDGLQSHENYVQSKVLSNPKDFSPGNSLLITSQPHTRSLADSLQTRINYTRRRMMGLFRGLPNVNDDFEFMLSLRAEDQPENSNPEKRLWARNIFHDTPKGAIVALMKKFQNDVLNSKHAAYSELLRILETEK